MIKLITSFGLLAWVSTGCTTETITHIHSENIGSLAIRIIEPSMGRYVEGAPVVVIPGAFFTPGEGFSA